MVVGMFDRLVVGLTRCVVVYLPDFFDTKSVKRAFENLCTLYIVRVRFCIMFEWILAI